MAKKQAEFPGMEKKRIKEIDDAAESYVEARDKRMKLTEREVETKDTLIRMMQKHKLAIYRDDETALEVVLVEGDVTVKVRLVKEKPPKPEKPEPPKEKAA